MNNLVYTVYKITNTVNGNEYIGIHRERDGEPLRLYMGSGKLLPLAFEKYGIDKFEKTILYRFDNPEEMFNKERELVDAEYIARRDTYNIRLGGIGAWPEETKLKPGEKFVYDNNFSVIRINCEDFNEELHSELAFGKILTKYADGATNERFYVSVDDPRIKSGELVHYSKGMQSVIDKDGSRFRANLDDVRFDTGEIVSVYNGLVFRRNIDTGEWKWVDAHNHDKELWVAPTTDKVVVKYADSRNQDVFVCDINDPLYLDRTYIPHNTGTFTAKDKNGNYIKISKDDPRYISGELTGMNKNMVVVKYADGRTTDRLRVSIDDPRYLSGELISATVGNVHSEETRKKISERAKARKGKFLWVHCEELGIRTKINKELVESFLIENPNWNKGRGKNKCKE